VSPIDDAANFLISSREPQPENAVSPGVDGALSATADMKQHSVSKMRR